MFSRVSRTTKRFCYPFLLLVLTAGSISSISLASELPSAQAVASMLKQADAFRIKIDEGLTYSEIFLYRDGELEESNRYRVSFDAEGKSRVEMLATRAKGQKVLLLPDAMWLYVPRTKKAIRITPMQRLMGQASYGDVASMRWSDEYAWDGSQYEQTTLGDQQAIRLGLVAKRKSSTYRKLSLWLTPDSAQPLKAEFHLASGKLMKTASYHLAENRQDWIDRIEFRQPGKEDELTVLTSTEPEAKTFPAMLFTRQGFVK